MNELRHGDVVEQVAALLHVSNRKDMNLFLVGSARPSKKRFFNSSLSDLDLLFICHPKSITEYSDCFVYINHVVGEVDGLDGHIVEAFFGSASVAELYFSCLATIMGDDCLRENDLVFRSSTIPIKSDTLPLLEVRRKLYIARAIYFCRAYERVLPVANTEKARKVAKVLLRGLKLVACAYTEADELRLVEKKLFSIATLKDMTPILGAYGWDLNIDPTFDTALSGRNIGSWSAWMIAQDRLSRQLHRIAPDQLISAEDLYFFETIVAVVHDMLVAGLKEVLIEKNDNHREKLINEYMNNTSSLIVKLTMSGVDSLYSFEDLTTPQIVKESYEIIVKYLGGENLGWEGLAASVILLEYSLKQALLYANANYK